MKTVRIAFFIGGLLCIGVCAIVLFQNAQTGSPASNVINVFFVVFGAIINFMQLFFAFPLFNHQAYNASPQATSAPKKAPQSYPSLSLSRGSRYLLGTRGLCYIIMGAFLLAVIATNASNNSALLITLGVAMLLPGMATLGMAGQEWNTSRKRRWFLPEGIFGSLAGLLLILSAPQATSNTPPAIAWVGLVALILWIMTASIGEILASNGWALTTGGILSLLEIVSSIVAVIVGNASPIAQFVPYVVLVGYPILFGIVSVIGAFQ